MKSDEGKNEVGEQSVVVSHVVALLFDECVDSAVLRRVPILSAMFDDESLTAQSVVVSLCFFLSSPFSSALFTLSFSFDFFLFVFPFRTFNIFFLFYVFLSKKSSLKKSSGEASITKCLCDWN